MIKEVCTYIFGSGMGREKEGLKMTEALREIEEKRLAVLEKHLKNGVIFEGTGGVVIEEDVVIGTGTRISPNVTLRGNTSVGRDCVLTGGTVLEDCVVGDRTVIRSSECFQSKIGSGVSIGPFAHLRPGSVLGDRVHAGNFVEIKNSVIGEGTAVAHLTYVGDSDVGRCVNFGCGCVTVNYDGEHKHRCRIGDYAFIGCNANLIAPVEVGEQAFIAAGSTITDGVEDGGFAIARARQVNKPGLGVRKLAAYVRKKNG